MTHYLRDKTGRTIVDIDTSVDDLSCTVDIAAYTFYLTQLNLLLWSKWMLDMSRIQEIRGEYFETPNQENTPREFVEHVCKEIATKWDLYYVVD